ncbi:MAG: peptidylprolyl isomerase [Prevotellaceae bacterium]|jgi:peptidyl-prolyl cis-trans isomerase SurA|nr:peptidylprolyl isomerase [Prevotellaceae bacterium]
MNKILAALAFFAAVHIGAQEQKIDGIVAVVGDEIITETDVNDAMNQARAEGQTVTNKCDFVENMMKEKIILYKAKQDTLITVDNNSITRETDSRIDYFKGNFGSEENLLKAYSFKTMGEFRNLLTTMLKNQEYVRQKMQSITKNIDVSPEDVKNFYKAHEAEFPYLNEEVEYSQLYIYPKLTDVHKQQLIDKLKDIKNRILEGESFADLAKRYSEDPSSAQNGGLYAGVKRGKMVKEFDAVAFSLQEGQISEPFETEFGFHIIFLEKKRGQTLDLRHILLKATPDREEIKAALAKLEGIRDDIKAEKITFKDAVLKYSDDKYSKFNAGAVSNNQTGDNRFEKLKLPTKILYNLSGLKKSDLSDVFEDKENDRDVVKLLKLTDIIPAHKMNLDVDYARIKNFTQREKENDAVSKWITNQISSTFITIQDDYKSCNLTIDWLQQGKK